MRLPLPPTIVFIKTTGQEEGNAGYTRENAIVLPRRLLGSPAAELQKLLAHELFHIASRASPALAPLLYEAIGFRPCGEAEFPESLAARKITNPDAPRNDYCIRVMLDGEEVSATPILFSRSDTYDGARGGEFFEYLQLALLLRTEPAPETTEGPAPRVVGLRDVSGFFEQVGRNTQYIIHPEEILADNFALLVLAPPTVASPDVLARVRGALASFPAAPRTAPAQVLPRCTRSQSKLGATWLGPRARATSAWIRPLRSAGSSRSTAPRCSCLRRSRSRCEWTARCR